MTVGLTGGFPALLWSSTLKSPQNKGFHESVLALTLALAKPAEEKKMADEKIVTIPLSKMVSELAEKHAMSKKAMGELLAGFVDLTVRHLKKGAKVRVTGLGIFQVRKRPARMGRNPATGEAIKIKASKKLAFRAAKEVKEAI
jgi:DNA-binding protein HU-beta